MQIYLARNNQQAGPYTVEQLNQMLASQQVLLTDLAWHQGMAEWKALGELTQGQMIYRPEGYVTPTTTPDNAPFGSTYSQPHATATSALPKDEELASIPSRVLAKFIDILLWLPALAIPSFYMNASQVQELGALQQKIQAAGNSDQAAQLQSQLFQLIPNDAWMMMGIYVVLMLALQAFFLVKRGQSIGKRITKIKIVDAENNTQVSLMRVFTIRTLIFLVLTLLFFPLISIIDSLFAFSKKRQTLHDKLAKTKVVKQ